jgi:hypothetical protein
MALCCSGGRAGLYKDSAWLPAVVVVVLGCIQIVEAPCCSGTRQKRGWPEYDSMDRTAWAGKLGTRMLTQAAGTGQMGQASWIGKLGRDNWKRTAMAGKI